MAAKSCTICGAPSGMYPLCTKCFRLRDDGKIVQCSDCKTWYKVENGHKCGVTAEKAEKTETLQSATLASNTNCILCGTVSNGKLFCVDCYRKYKNKELFVKIVNCADFTIFDEAYEGRFTCKDGHIVKSKSEVLIDNYFYERSIRHVYEKELQISNTEFIHPDFYLPDKDLYLEHWGLDTSPGYKRQKEYKLQKYRERGMTVISTKEVDIAKLDSRLEFKLNTYVKGKVNEE